jgi:hypothetical protein
VFDVAHGNSNRRCRVAPPNLLLWHACKQCAQTLIGQGTQEKCHKRLDSHNAISILFTRRRRFCKLNEQELRRVLQECARNCPVPMTGVSQTSQHQVSLTSVSSPFYPPRRYQFKTEVVNSTVTVLTMKLCSCFNCRSRRSRHI